MRDLAGPCGRKAARAFFFVLVAGCASGGREIALRDGSFRVSLAPSEVSSLVGVKEPDLRRVWSVRVEGSQEPLFGRVRIEGETLLFEPSYPPAPGVTYRAIFDPSAIPGGSGTRTERTFSLPAPPPGPATRVVRVAPSRDVLPENQLKFYLYFSAPMSRGEAYERVRLLRDGREVEHPFLELGEELWDHSGSRLTLFFDPGRIKRELRPREEVGPSLEEGKSYVLIVDRGWRDAEGRPLEGEYRKTFKAVGPDVKQPDPARWTVAAPPAGSREPLTVTFDEPLDHAMLGRVLEVVGVPGRIEIDREETRWRFRPEKPWTAGRHALQVDALLEDLAGNSIAKPFEVDVFRPIERKVVSKTVSIPFDVR